MSVNNFSEFPININKISKIPIRLPPTNSPDGMYYEHPIPDYDVELPSIIGRQSSSSDIDFLDEEKDIFPLPNVRRRRQNDQGRLLSQSAFNRITETLGALNAVGNFFLNMTREVNGENNRQDDMQLISSSSSKIENKIQPSTEKISTFSNDLSTTTQESVTTTTKLFSTIKSSTKTTEPFNKRIGLSEQPVKGSRIDEQTLNEKIDMAALAEKKRKKHQAISTKKEIITTHTSNPTTLSPGKYYSNKISNDIKTSYKIFMPCSTH